MVALSRSSGRHRLLCNLLLAVLVISNVADELSYNTLVAYAQDVAVTQTETSNSDPTEQGV